MKKSNLNQTWYEKNRLRKHRHHLKRKLKRRIKRYRLQNITPTKKSFGKKSKINKKIAKYASRQLFIDRKKEIKITVPKTFSIIEDPEGALDLISAFAKTVAESEKNRIRYLYFDHTQLKNYDLAANALLGIVAHELDAEFKLRGSRFKLHSRGKLPSNSSVKRFIRAIGIIRNLDIKHEAPSKKESSVLEVFDNRVKHYSLLNQGTSPSRCDAIAKKFVDHINKCLKNINKKLKPKGVARLTEYLAEILNNAEEHAEFIDWSLQGYLDSSAAVPICEIAIFNFGKSISQTLETLPKDHYTRDQIREYITKHEGGKLFGSTWKKQDLLTVIALQPHVSSKNLSQTDTRGQGTVDLMQFFQKVHQECTDSTTGAKMAILSGDTHIKFDGTHALGADPKSQQQVIAFNKNNSLYDKPDNNYVRSLGKHYFPGTIISIRFPLTSSSFTEEAKNGA